MNNVVRLADYRRPDRELPSVGVEPPSSVFVLSSALVWIGGAMLGIYVMWLAVGAFVSAWGQ